MAIGFISLALKDRVTKFKDDKKDNINTGFAITSVYLLQGIIGFSISLFLAYTLCLKSFRHSDFFCL
jgi:glutamate:Na+ symporter, ESS family